MGWNSLGSTPCIAPKGLAVPERAGNAAFAGLGQLGRHPELALPQQGGAADGVGLAIDDRFDPAAGQGPEAAGGGELAPLAGGGHDGPGLRSGFQSASRS